MRPQVLPSTLNVFGKLDLNKSVSVGGFSLLILGVVSSEWRLLSTHRNNSTQQTPPIPQITTVSRSRSAVPDFADASQKPTLEKKSTAATVKHIFAITNAGGDILMTLNPTPSTSPVTMPTTVQLAKAGKRLMGI